MKIKREYPSKSNPNGKPHVATFDTDSRTATCTCRGFRSPARCWHVTDIAAAYEAGTLTADAPSVSQAALAVAVAPFVKPAAARVEPMLASAMTKGTLLPYQNDGWIGEEKYDGDRQLTTVKAGVVIESRSRAGNTRTLPADVVAELRHLPDGTYDLEDMASRKTIGGDRDGRRVVIFDVVAAMGESTIARPLTERRALLEVAFAHIERALGEAPRFVALSTQFPVSPFAIEAIFVRGGEGAILKRKASKYQSGARSADWIKVKREGAAVVEILRFEDAELPSGKTWVRDAKGREFTVRTGAGNVKVLRDVQANPAVYLGARLVIEYTEALASGAYRHPRWDHLASEKE